MPDDLSKLQRTPRETARWQRAQQDLLGGQSVRALAGYSDLVQRYPGVAQLWFELGIAATGQLGFDMADQAFQRSIELSRHDAPMLVLIGQQYHRLRRLRKARECFEQAVAVAPKSVHARLSLAVWYEREHKLEEAIECVEACLAEHPHDAQARCVSALLLHRKGRNAEAEAVLRAVANGNNNDPNVRYSSRQLLGVVLDALGQHAEALRWLREAKDVQRRTVNAAKMEQDYDRSDRWRRKLLAALTPETIRQWRKEAGAEAPARLALLGGHPRSGTTLLERILGAHPEIMAFDESEAFAQEVWDPLAPLKAVQGLALESLSRMPLARRGEMRRRYFKSLLRETDTGDGGKLLLDKNPSLTAALHLWTRILPEAKIIIALRDPRDVIISCYFQNLILTPANANFLTLERAAKHYADLMDVWLRMRELGGLDWIETRYESVVENLESEGRRVTEFLGLSWHADQAKHHELSRQKFLFAPTYNDVTKPVHRRSVGRWERYSEALAPIQPLLEPYCRAFGYATG